MANATVPTVKKVSKQKPVEGSAAEEATESPAFERIEDAHDETTQIKKGTARHTALMNSWKAPSKGGKTVKLGHKTGAPKATK